MLLKTIIFHYYTSTTTAILDKDANHDVVKLNFCINKTVAECFTFKSYY